MFELNSRMAVHDAVGVLAVVATAGGRCQH